MDLLSGLPNYFFIIPFLLKGVLGVSVPFLRDFPFFSHLVRFPLGQPRKFLDFFPDFWGGFPFVGKPRCGVRVGENPGFSNLHVI